MRKSALENNSPAGHKGEVEDWLCQHVRCFYYFLTSLLLLFESFVEIKDDVKQTEPNWPTIVCLHVDKLFIKS